MIVGVLTGGCPAWASALRPKSIGGVVTEGKSDWALDLLGQRADSGLVAVRATPAPAAAPNSHGRAGAPAFLSHVGVRASSRRGVVRRSFWALTRGSDAWSVAEVVATPRSSFAGCSSASAGWERRGGGARRCPPRAVSASASSRWANVHDLPDVGRHGFAGGVPSSLLEFPGRAAGYSPPPAPGRARNTALPFLRTLMFISPPPPASCRSRIGRRPKIMNRRLGAPSPPLRVGGPLAVR